MAKHHRKQIKSRWVEVSQLPKIYVVCDESNGGVDLIAILHFVEFQGGSIEVGIITAMAGWNRPLSPKQRKICSVCPRENVSQGVVVNGVKHIE